jgi:hypothetical protein
MREVSNRSIVDLIREANEYDYCTVQLDVTPAVAYHEEKSKQTVLPDNPILLSDPIQVKYFGDNAAVKEAIATIKRRRLDTAINQYPYYISITDFVHRNRLCIPFIDTGGKINFYQTRELFPRADGCGVKYLSKSGGDKTIFGANLVSVDLPYIYITEGPIDSCFIRNGTSMGGLVITAAQRRELSQFMGLERIWVLDNELHKPDVREKYEALIAAGERVFIWPKVFANYKDVNEVCVEKGIDEMPTSLFEKFSYTGNTATSKIKEQYYDTV